MNSIEYIPRVIGLDKETNLKFYEVVDQYNVIVDEWNRLNRQIIENKQPKFWLFGHKRRLKSIALEIQSLQKRFLAWNARAGDFLIKPDFKFKAHQESEIGFLHYSGFLRDLRDSLDHHMVLLATNMNNSWNQHSSQINFLIAIISFALTLAGLVATLLTLS